jgi:hypothetical protein
MPVTARLSRKFYERLGEDVANELVDWFNAVDATYRNDLRELNELNFQRFDAKVEQRFAQSRVEFEQRFAQFRVDVEQRFATLETKLDSGLQGLRTEFDAKLNTGLSGLRAEMIKWMFIFWAGTVIPLAGLLLAVRG